MIEKISKFMKKLENPNHPLLGPNLQGLQAWGLWQPKKTDKICLILFIIFVLSQYVELWLIRSDLESAFNNLSKTTFSTVCAVKAVTFIYWQDYWRSIVNYVSTLEKSQLSKKDKVTNEIIGAYTKYSRMVTYFFWCLVAATCSIVVFAPLGSFLLSAEQRELIRNGLAPYPEIISSWMPFDKSRGYGYCAATLVQSLFGFYGSGIVANYDSNAVVLMSFFAGQLRLLSVNCARLFEDGNEVVSDVDAMERIKHCHHHHVFLIKYSRILNSLLSPIMFLYVITCSLMICTSALQLTSEGTTGTQLIWITEYLVALITQLFLYCWHSNEVLVMSDAVEDGVYESTWWSRNIRIRRSILLLGGQLRKSIVFTAGPFTQLTVATFITILKGAYSYYTILSQTED